MANKELDIKAEKSKVFKGLVSALFLFFIIFSFAVIKIQNRSFKVSENRHDKMTNKIMQIVVSKTLQRYKEELYSISLDSRVKQDILLRKREDLYRVLKPKYALLKKMNSYINIMHVILPNGNSFLRVHKKDKYGDNLYKLRPMIRDAVSNQKVVYGFESGKYANSFRVIIPLYFDGRYIASFEIGISPVYFLGVARETLGTQGYLFIKKDNLYMHHDIDLRYGIGDYYLQNELYFNDLKLLVDIPKKEIFKENYLFEYNDREYVTHVIDIKGYLGGAYGKFLFLEDISNFRALQKREIAYLFFALLLFILIIVLLARYFLQRLESKITEIHKNSSREIAKRESYLKTLITSNPNIVISIVEEEIESANSKFFEFTGFNTIEEFKKEHKCICEFFVQKEGYLGIYNDGVYWLDKIISGKTSEYFVIMAKDKREYVFRVFANTIEFDKAKRYIVSFVDVTEMIELRRELLKNKDLMIAQSKQAAMGEMISMIAHQWRQPISVISMSINNLLIDIELGELSEDGVKECGAEILTETEYLSKTIDDFRNFFKPNKNRELVGLQSIFDDTKNIIGKSLENSGITLLISMDEEIELKIYKSEFLQVLLNLINNAKDALQESDTEDKKIEIKAYREDDFIMFKICDNAGGVEPSIQERIFEPYFSTKLEKNGTGLGLYMCKIIVDKNLLGKIWLKNSPKGACFMIKLTASV